MKWEEIRRQYQQQWLLVEAIEARSEAENRILDDLAVLDIFPDSVIAMQRYAELHRLDPARELYVFHTDRAELNVTERRWLGVRGEA